MPANQRIAVVGAGIVGCAVAFELARGEAEVVVYDERGIAEGATQASAGILAPYTEAHAGGPLFDLTVRGLRIYEEFVARVRGIASRPFEFRACGTIELASDDTRAAELRSRVHETWAANADLTWLDAEGVRSLEPAVGAACRGGLLCGVHGYVAVVPFVEALVEGAIKLGARFRAGVAVRELTFDERGVHLRSDRGLERFDHVVLCGGSWSERLDPFGELAGRTRPVRGQLLRLRWQERTVSRILWSRDCYIVPWEDGTLLVGATSEEAGFDERATVGGVEALLTAAREILPGIEGATFDGVRVGLRPATSDGLPIIGSSAADPRLFYALGHFRNGILLAPLTAELTSAALKEA